MAYEHNTIIVRKCLIFFISVNVLSCYTKVSVTEAFLVDVIHQLDSFSYLVRDKKNPKKQNPKQTNKNILLQEIFFYN